MNHCRFLLAWSVLLLPLNAPALTSSECDGIKLVPVVFEGSNDRFKELRDAPDFAAFRALVTAWSKTSTRPDDVESVAEASTFDAGSFAFTEKVRPGSMVLVRTFGSDGTAVNVSTVLERVLAASASGQSKTIPLGTTTAVGVPAKDFHGASHQEQLTLEVTFKNAAQLKCRYATSVSHLALDRLWYWGHGVAGSPVSFTLPGFALNFKPNEPTIEVAPVGFRVGPELQVHPSFYLGFGGALFWSIRPGSGSTADAVDQAMVGVYVDLGGYLTLTPAYLQDFGSLDDGGFRLAASISPDLLATLSGK